MKWLKKLTSKGKSKTDSAPAASSNAHKPAIKFSDYITEKNIAFFPAGPSKQQVLGKLIGSLDLPDPTAALKAILAREEAGSTVIAPGLSLPHARLTGISKISAAVGICPSGFVDHREGGAPIHLFVLFVGPADSMKEHLAFLSYVSALFQKDGFVESLIPLTSPRDVLTAVLVAEKSL